MTRYRILSTHTDGERWNAPSYFLLDVNDELRAVLTFLRSEVLLLKDRLSAFRDGDLSLRLGDNCDLVVWRYLPYFFGEMEPQEAKGCPESLKQSLNSMGEDCGLTEAEAVEAHEFLDQLDGEAGGYIRLDYCKLVCDERGFFVRACPKHADYEVSTCMVRWSEVL